MIPSLLKAAPCSETIKLINADINKYPSPLQDHQLPWMNLPWLQQHLGRVQISTTTENQTKYKWQCPENTDVFLVILANKNGELNSVEGQYSSEREGSDIFSANIERNDVTVKPNTQTSKEPQQATDSSHSEDMKVGMDVKLVKESDFPMNKGNLEKAKIQAIQSLNEWFGVHIENDQQLNELVLNKITTYFSQLRSCTPGIYKYPILDPMAIDQTDHTKPVQFFLLETSTISGYKNGLCIVNSTIKQNGKSSAISCNYSPTSLSLHTDELAKSVSRMGPLAFAANVSTRKIMVECKKTPTEQDTAEQASLLDYISKFKSCTPGTYTNPRGPAKVVTVISGYLNNKCIMQNTHYFGNSQTKINCTYSQDSLNLFADAKIKALNGTSTQNPQAITPELRNTIQKAFKECDKTWMPF